MPAINLRIVGLFHAVISGRAGSTAGAPNPGCCKPPTSRSCQMAKDAGCRAGSASPRLAASEDDRRRSLEPALYGLDTEHPASPVCRSEDASPRSESVITPLSGILVVQAIRPWTARDPAARTGWLGAQPDGVTSRNTGIRKDTSGDAADTVRALP